MRKSAGLPILYGHGAHLLATGVLILVHRRHELVQLVGTRAGHDALPQRLVWCVQRQRQANARQVLAQLRMRPGVRGRELLSRVQGIGFRVSYP